MINTGLYTIIYKMCRSLRIHWRDILWVKKEF